jgi:plastocyanin domain-containing protein
MTRCFSFVVAALLVTGAACSKTEPAAKPAPAAAAAPAAPIATTGRRIDVTVTKEGYKPDKIDVAANEEVTLVFTRTEETECGSEVAIPSMNVKKALPLNQAVAIAFKADKPGEVGFTCGMDMYKGTLVVR